MKFACGQRGVIRDEMHRDWHPFFAIIPVKVAKHDCRFFEWVDRKGKQTWEVDGYSKFRKWTWTYRAKPGPTKPEAGRVSYNMVLPNADPHRNPVKLSFRHQGFKASLLMSYGDTEYGAVISEENARLLRDALTDWLGT